MTEGLYMALFKQWAWLIMPHKFYGGGGSTTTTTTYNQDNPQQQALADVAQKKYDYYQANYVPLENQWMSNVSNMDSQANHDLATGMAANSLKQEAGAQTQTAGSTMQGGRMMQGNYLAGADALANAETRADMGTTNRMLQGEQGIVAMGQGQSTGAIEGLGSVAAQSVHGQNANMEHAFNQQQATQGIYGTGLGMAAAAGINKYGS